MVSFTNWVALPLEKENLLTNSVVAWVGTVVLCMYYRRENSIALTRNQTLYCPAHNIDTGLTVLSLATEAVSPKLCVPELIKMSLSRG